MPLYSVGNDSYKEYMFSRQEIIEMTNKDLKHIYDEECLEIIILRNTGDTKREDYHALLDYDIYVYQDFLAFTQSRLVGYEIYRSLSKNECFYSDSFRRIGVIDWYNIEQFEIKKIHLSKDDEFKIQIRDMVLYVSKSIYSFERLKNDIIQNLSQSLRANMISKVLLEFEAKDIDQILRAEILERIKNEIFNELSKDVIQVNIENLNVVKRDLFNTKNISVKDSVIYKSKIE